VNPFHANRCADDRRHFLVQTVWTFDIDCNILRIDRDGYHTQVPLATARRKLITMDDFEPCQPFVRPDTMSFLIGSHQYSRLVRGGLNYSRMRRRRSLVSALLNDFALQWRHILTSPYNNSTFRRLAIGIIRLITLDFTTREINYPRKGSRSLVRISDILRWQIWYENIVCVVSVSIVMCQHLAHASSLIRSDYFQLKREFTEGTAPPSIYLILSLQEICLCRISHDNKQYTQPLGLLNNTLQFSSCAIELLPQATQQTPQPFLYCLPIEIHDMVLNYVSVGPTERAKIGCTPNIGTIFDWKEIGRDIMRKIDYTDRRDGTPVESHIWFGTWHSGLMYK
jgi:hypothetical protein